MPATPPTKLPATPPTKPVPVPPTAPPYYDWRAELGRLLRELTRLVKIFADEAEKNGSPLKK